MYCFHRLAWLIPKATSIARCTRIDASLKPSYEHLGRVTRNKPWDEEIECDRGPERDQVKATAAEQVTHAISPFLSFANTFTRMGDLVRRSPTRITTSLRSLNLVAP